MYVQLVARVPSAPSAAGSPLPSPISHASGVRRVGKLTPPGTRRCLSCVSTSGRVSTSPFLYNISQKSDSQKRRQGSGSYPAHSSGQVLVGTGFVRTRPSGGPSCGPSHPLSAPVTPMHAGSRPSRPLSHSRHNPHNPAELNWTRGLPRRAAASAPYVPG